MNRFSGESLCHFDVVFFFSLPILYYFSVCIFIGLHNPHTHKTSLHQRIVLCVSGLKIIYMVLRFMNNRYMYAMDSAKNEKKNEKNIRFCFSLELSWQKNLFVKVILTLCFSFIRHRMLQFFLFSSLSLSIKLVWITRKKNKSYLNDVPAWKQIKKKIVLKHTCLVCKNTKIW